MFREMLARDCAGILAVALIAAGGGTPHHPTLSPPLPDDAGKRKAAAVQSAGGVAPPAIGGVGGSSLPKRPRLAPASSASADAAQPASDAGDDGSSWSSHIRLAWRMFDINGTGFLEVSELLAIFAASDLNFSLGALQTILKRVSKPPPDAAPQELRQGSRAHAPPGSMWRVALADILPLAT